MIFVIMNMKWQQLSSFFSSFFFPFISINKLQWRRNTQFKWKIEFLYDAVELNQLKYSINENLSSWIRIYIFFLSSHWNCYESKYNFKCGDRMQPIELYCASISRTCFPSKVILNILYLMMKLKKPLNAQPSNTLFFFNNM